MAWPGSERDQVPNPLRTPNFTQGRIPKKTGRETNRLPPRYETGLRLL